MKMISWAVCTILLTLILPINASANDQKVKLATELCKLVYPAEFYSVYLPVTVPVLSIINVDKFNLNPDEKVSLLAQLKEMLIKATFDELVQARAEILSVDEMNILINLYKTDIGKSIIDKSFKAGQHNVVNQNKVQVILTAEETNFIEKFNSSQEGKRINLKLGATIQALGMKMQENADKIGMQTALILAEATKDKK